MRGGRYGYMRNHQSHEMLHLADVLEVISAHDLLLVFLNSETGNAQITERKSSSSDWK